MIAAVRSGEPGDVALLHGCCHNPTGADLDDAQWDAVAAAIARRRLLPFIDLAYQGLGRGLVEDARGLHRMLATCDEVIVAHSCDKNFGLYRDRVGSLWIKTASERATRVAMDHVLQISRVMWSMPPDHGAATVRLVLEDAALTADWLAELSEMRERIARVRTTIAAADPRLAFVGRQFGMFSMLPLDLGQVKALRQEHGIYMADSGRFNVLGMADDALDRFIAAIVEAMNGRG
jgi:aromatic-amino-acid transaminase